MLPIWCIMNSTVSTVHLLHCYNDTNYLCKNAQLIVLMEKIIDYQLAVSISVRLYNLCLIVTIQIHILERNLLADSLNYCHTSCRNN